MDDDDVLAGIAASHRAAAERRDAFAGLYHRHIATVYRYLLARMGNAADAEDLTAQTFLAALENIRHYKPRGKFIAWLLTISRNKWADFYRGSRRAAEVPLEQMRDELTYHPNFEIRLDQKLQWQRLAVCLQSLAPDRAEAVRLRLLAGLSVAEVAQVMERSEDAVKMLVSRGLRDLRERLASDAAHSGE